jgi:hypothetical protein
LGNHAITRVQQMSARRERALTLARELRRSRCVARPHDEEQLAPLFVDIVHVPRARNASAQCSPRHANRHITRARRARANSGCIQPGRATGAVGVETPHDDTAFGGRARPTAPFAASTALRSVPTSEVHSVLRSDRRRDNTTLDDAVTSEEC